MRRLHEEPAHLLVTLPADVARAQRSARGAHDRSKTEAHADVPAFAEAIDAVDRGDTLRIYYYDTSASDMKAWFRVNDLCGGIVDEWSVSSNTSSGNSFSDSAEINHTISYGVYSYAVNVHPIVTGATMQFCGARIFYNK